MYETIAAFGEFWAEHPVACTAITVGAVAACVLLAGPAGLGAGSYLATGLYSALGIVLAQAVIMVSAGLFGGGGSEGTDGSAGELSAPDPEIPRVIVLTRGARSSLQAEIRLHSGAVLSETWTGSNISERAKALGLRDVRARVRLKVEFVDVPEQLADSVVERLQSRMVEVRRSDRRVEPPRP